MSRHGSESAGRGSTLSTDVKSAGFAYSRHVERSEGRILRTVFRLTAVAAVALLVAVACLPDDRVHLRESDVVGVWRGPNGETIVLDGDSRFAADGLSDVILDSSERPTGAIPEVERGDLLRLFMILVARSRRSSSTLDPHPAQQAASPLGCEHRETTVPSGFTSLSATLT